MPSHESATPVPEQRYLVVLIAECFLDQPLGTSRWAAYPLTTDDPLYTTAVEAWAATKGFREHGWQGGPNQPPVDLVAIEGAAGGVDGHDALAKSKPAMTALLRAIAFRQARAGRILAWIAAPDIHGLADVEHEYPRRAEVHHSFSAAHDWDPGLELEGWLHAIETSPTGPLLTDLFVEAVADASRDGCVARLWSMLEVLASRFPARGRPAKLRTVQAAMEHLAPADRVDLAEVYRYRNAFVHEGRRGDADLLEPIRSTLIGVCFLALARAGFAVVDPAAPHPQPDPDAPIRRVAFRAPTSGWWEAK